MTKHGGLDEGIICSFTEHLVQFSIQDGKIPEPFFENNSNYFREFFFLMKYGRRNNPTSFALSGRKRR